MVFPWFSHGFPMYSRGEEHVDHEGPGWYHFTLGENYGKTIGKWWFHGGLMMVLHGGLMGFRSWANGFSWDFSHA